MQKVGAGANPIGLADMGTVLVAKGKGANVVGVFNVYANSPQGLYWLNVITSYSIHYTKLYDCATDRVSASTSVRPEMNATA